MIDLGCGVWGKGHSLDVFDPRSNVVTQVNLFCCYVLLTWPILAC